MSAPWLILAAGFLVNWVLGCGGGGGGGGGSGGGSGSGSGNAMVAHTPRGKRNDVLGANHAAQGVSTMNRQRNNQAPTSSTASHSPHLGLSLWLAAGLLLVPSVGAASDLQTWPLTVSLSDNALGRVGAGGGVLFHGPIHPGARTGTEYTYFAGPHLRLFQSVALGYANGPLDRMGGLLVEINLAVRVLGPLQVEGSLGNGVWWGQFVGGVFDSHGKPLGGGFWYLTQAARLGLAVTLPWWIEPDVIAGYEVRTAALLNHGGGSALPLSAFSLAIRIPFPLSGGAQ